MTDCDYDMANLDACPQHPDPPRPWVPAYGSVATPNANLNAVELVEYGSREIGDGGGRAIAAELHTMAPKAARGLLK